MARGLPSVPSGMAAGFELDHPTGDYDKLIVSVMDKLMGLPGDVTVFPGHGPNTTISDERTHNPFLQPFNEPDSDMIDWDADGIELDGTI